MVAVCLWIRVFGQLLLHIGPTRELSALNSARLSELVLKLSYSQALDKKSTRYSSFRLLYLLSAEPYQDTGHPGQPLVNPQVRVPEMPLIVTVYAAEHSQLV